MKQILVTGANGQLGSSLKERSRFYNQFEYTFIDFQDLDLTKEHQVQQFFEKRAFDYIINCAAYTAVDRAEKEREQAFSVNEGIPVLLGNLCRQRPVYLLHISTDYVYSGESWLPHLEEEDPAVTSVYAESKLKGEMSLWNNSRCMVIRTSWLYSEYGNNFLRNMIRLFGERSELGVVFDQTGSPTYAGDLAQALLDIIVYSENHGFKSGIFNYANEGVCSWYDFAVEIMSLTGSVCNVHPIRTSEYPLPARRPEYSVMDKTKIKSTFGLKIPHWKQSLITAIHNLNHSYEFRLP